MVIAQELRKLYSAYYVSDEWPLVEPFAESLGLSVELTRKIIEAGWLSTKPENRK